MQVATAVVMLKARTQQPILQKVFNFVAVCVASRYLNILEKAFYSRYFPSQRTEIFSLDSAY